MSNTVVDGNLHVRGTLTLEQVTLPSGSVANANVAANAGIEATKVVAQHAIYYQQAGGVNIAAATVPIHIARATATIVGVEVVVLGAAGGDRTATIDLQKGSQSSAYATVLTSVITVNSGVAARQVVAGSLSTTAVADNDSLQVVVAVGGSSGTQPQGLLVVVTLRENPQ